MKSKKEDKCLKNQAIAADVLMEHIESLMIQIRSTVACHKANESDAVSVMYLSKIYAAILKGMQ